MVVVETCWYREEEAREMAVEVTSWSEKEEVGVKKVVEVTYIHKEEEVKVKVVVGILKCEVVVVRGGGGDGEGGGGDLYNMWNWDLNRTIML